MKTQPIRKVLFNHKISSLCTIGVGGFLGSLTLTLLGYIPTYLVTIIKIPMEEALLLNSTAILLFALLTVLFGHLADKTDGQKIMMFTPIFSFILIFPIYFFLSLGCTWSILLGLCILAFLAACFLGPCHAVMYTLFPTYGRYSGVGLNFSLGLAFIGSTGPLITSSIIAWTRQPIFAALYVFGTSILGFSALYLIKKKNLMRYSSF